MKRLCLGLLLVISGCCVGRRYTSTESFRDFWPDPAEAPTETDSDDSTD